MNTPRFVHDGVAEIDQLPLGSSVDLCCPLCGDDFAADPIAVLRAARSIGLASSAEERSVVRHLADALDWEVRPFGEFVSISGHRGLSPGVTLHTCEHCTDQVWVVTSHGELQPGRNAAVIEGTIAPPPSR